MLCEGVWAASAHEQKILHLFYFFNWFCFLSSCSSNHLFCRMPDLKICKVLCLFKVVLLVIWLSSLLLNHVLDLLMRTCMHLYSPWIYITFVNCWVRDVIHVIDTWGQYHFTFSLWFVEFHFNSKTTIRNVYIPYMILQKKSQLPLLQIVYWKDLDRYTWFEVRKYNQLLIDMAFLCFLFWKNIISFSDMKHSYYVCAFYLYHFFLILQYCPKIFKSVFYLHVCERVWAEGFFCF